MSSLKSLLLSSPTLALRHKIFATHIRMRPPQSELSPDRVYAYLDSIWRCRDVPGAIVEVGCFRGGTTCVAFRFLAETGISKEYVALDTFAGFVGDHFQHDLAHGTNPRVRRGFSRNSVDGVRQLLDSSGCEQVQLIEGDVSQLPESQLPDEVSVCLLDVDLDIPTYDGLSKIMPRLASGGLVLVDDCHPHNAFAGARAGYRRFAAEAGISEDYFMNMGIVHGL